MEIVAADIQGLRDQFDAAECDARALIEGLDEEGGSWRASGGSWSVAECLEHLAVTNRAYLQAMKEPAARARQQGRLRKGPALPGLIGDWFARTMEPPVKAPFRMRAPKSVKPREAPALSDALARFTTSQNEVREFLRAYADLDLAAVRFPNPFFRGLRFSLATGLHVIAAHERRHLWQAWRVRREAETAGVERDQTENTKTGRRG